MPIVPLSQPCPVSFLFLELRYVWGLFNFPRKHADVRQRRRLTSIPSPISFLF